MSTIDKKIIVEEQDENGSKTEESKEIKTIDILLDDSELNAHIAEFVHTVRQTMVACKENILTQENAQAAASAIADLRRTVHQHKRTAHALRRLLQDQEMGIPEIAVPSAERLH